MLIIYYYDLYCHLQTKDNVGDITLIIINVLFTLLITSFINYPYYLHENVKAMCTVSCLY